MSLILPHCVQEQRGIFQEPNEAQHEINYLTIDGIRHHMINLKQESWDASDWGRGESAHKSSHDVASRGTNTKGGDTRKRERILQIHGQKWWAVLNSRKSDHLMSVKKKKKSF